MIARAALIGSLAALCAATLLDPSAARTPDQLPATAERAYRGVAARFDDRDAFSIVAFMDQYWRLAGNPGFNASIDHIRDRLVSAGYSADGTAAAGHVRVEEFPDSARGWDYRLGTVEFDGVSDTPLLSRDR